MAIIQSTIRIYDDALKTNPAIATKVTSGAATAITVPNLPVGSELYATAQVTDDSNLTSLESAVYQFYTLPDVSYYTQPSAGQGSISARLIGNTNDVAIDYYGLRYSTDIDYTTYTDVQSQRDEIDIYGLNENTTYYVEPFVIDEFGRKYINDNNSVTVTTPYSYPTVAWTGLSIIGTTTWSQQVNIQSSTTVTAASVIYGPEGGTQTTTALTAQTGTQTVSLTGLTPNTRYTIKVSATNSAGTGYSSIQTITTDSAGATVALTFNDLVNTNNNLTVTSTATLDSSATITGHTISAHLRSDGSDSPVESHTQTNPTATYSDVFYQLDTDTEYYIYSTVTYTLGQDPTPLTARSTALTVNTYTLVSFGIAVPTNNSVTIPYSTDGVAADLSFQYSGDNGSTWTIINYPSLSSGTLSITGLTPNHAYMVKGRAQNTRAGWSGYASTSFSTTNVLPVVNITSIDQITTVSARANISVS